MAHLECGREASSALAPVAEDEHLAALVGEAQARIRLLRRLLRELRLDERGEGLLAAGLFVGDERAAEHVERQAGRLAERAAGELGGAVAGLAVARQPDGSHT